MPGLTYILQRFSDNRDSTLGIMIKISIQAGKEVGVFQGYTLEDEFRDQKISGETRIPSGIYNVDVQKEETPLTLRYRKKFPWFKNHLEVKNVTGFKGIYIHLGNYDQDSAGCILLGDNADNNVIGPGSISNSTVCFKRFYESVYPHLPVTLIIRDESYLVDR